jgi:hypothetical protein
MDNITEIPGTSAVKYIDIKQHKYYFFGLRQLLINWSFDEMESWLYSSLTIILCLS